MFFTGERKVPALLKSKAETQDNVSIKKFTTLKNGYMVKGDYENELGSLTSKVFPTESSAKSYAQGQEIIKVEVKWIP